MIKSMRKAAALAIALTAAVPMTATPALATGISDARITKILWTGGRILVYFNVTHSVVCGCCGDRYETTVNDAASQARMALIMTASPSKSPFTSVEPATAPRPIPNGSATSRS